MTRASSNVPEGDPEGNPAEIEVHGDRTARAAVRFRWPLAAAALIAFGVAAGPSRRVELDRNITAMFAADDPMLLDYRLLQREFGGNAVVMLVYRDAELLTSSGLERNAEVSRRVAAVEGVKGILSPALLNRLLRAVRPGSGAAAALGFGGGGGGDLPPLLRDEPIANRFERLFAGYTHAPDGRGGAVVAMLNEDHDRGTIERLRRIAGSLPPPLQPGDLVGEPVLIHDGFDLLERDGATLATGTIGLLGVVLLLTLRRIRFVILAIAVVVWADTMTRATLVWMGIEMSLVSTILVAVIAVIAVAAVLHLGVRWRVAVRRGRTSPVAAVTTLSLLAFPIVWTCLTDAAGFAALGVSGIVPVRQFGFMIAAASLFILVAVVSLVPLGLAYGAETKSRETQETRKGGVIGGWAKVIPGWGGASRFRIGGGAERLVRRWCMRLATSGLRHRSLLLATTGLLGAVAAWQTASLETETSFLQNFRGDSSIVSAYGRVERDFGGAGVWDVVLPAPDDLSNRYLDQVRRLEQRLRDIEVGGAKLTKVLSLADAEAIASEVPLLSMVGPAARIAGMREAMPVFSDALLTPSGADRPRRLRIMLRSREGLPADQKTALIDEVRRVVESHFRSAEFRESLGTDSDHVDDVGRVTGYYVMMSGLVARLLADQWRCFAVAIVAVWALLAVATRSTRLAVAALVPNLFPVFFVLAVSGLLGGKLNMGAAMIAAVSVGLTIDGSVHFLAAYRRHRFRGHRRESSAVHAAGRIGLPILLATLALVAGFGVIASSQFVPTATFGRLVAASLVVGTLVNLTVLPVLVTSIDPSADGSVGSSSPSSS